MFSPLQKLLRHGHHGGLFIPLPSFSKSHVPMRVFGMCKSINFGPCQDNEDQSVEILVTVGPADITTRVTTTSRSTTAAHAAVARSSFVRTPTATTGPSQRPTALTFPTVSGGAKPSIGHRSRKRPVSDVDSAVADGNMPLSYLPY